MPHPLHRRPTLVGVAVALVLGLGACSDDSARPVTEAPTATPSSPESAEGSPATEWVERQDPDSGVGFQLPTEDPAETGRQPGTDGTEVLSTRYAASEGDVRLSVSLLRTPSEPRAVRRTVRVQYVPFLVVDTVRNQGATEAGVVSNSRLRGVPFRGFDSQLTFVQSGRRAVWFTRAVELDDAVLVAQAVAYVPVDEDAVDRVRTVFRRLTNGLEIPR